MDTAWATERGTMTTCSDLQKQAFHWVLALKNSLSKSFQEMHGISPRQSSSSSENYFVFFKVEAGASFFCSCLGAQKWAPGQSLAFTKEPGDTVLHIE